MVLDSLGIFQMVCRVPMACKSFVGAAFVNFRSHFGTLSEFSLCGLRFRQANKINNLQAFRGTRELVVIAKAG